MKKLSLLFGMIVLMPILSGAQTDLTWIDLDGTNDFLDFGTDNILAGETQFTVEMRMHFDNSTGDYTIIGQRTADPNRTIVLQRWAGDFYLFLSNTNYGYCSFIPCEATIYHLAIVYDGAGASDSDRLKLYINGVLQTLTFNGTIDNISYVTSPAANLVLGCEHNGSATQLQFVTGQFGEFCIWNYPLTAMEINNRIIPEVAGTETGLVEYFHFDNGIPGGDNTGITSFAGGNGVSTITPTNMAMNGASSNFVGQPALTSIIDTSLTFADPVITSNATGAAYQWLDCNNGFAVIPGATSQTYTAEANGNYAVQITQGACTDTSACVTITTVGIVENSFGDKLLIYPNPTNGNFSIDLGAIYDNPLILITDVSGNIIESKATSQSQVLNLFIKEPAGIYIVSVQAGDKKAVIRLVKQ
jgi:hypothetical protein